MKILSSTVFLFFLFTCGTESLGAAESTVALKSQPVKLQLKWLGTAGWEIRTEKTTVLIDPFFSRKPRGNNDEWKSDTREIDRAIADGKVTRADYIFAGHSHHDHIGDIPYLAEKFHPKKIFGSLTTTNLLRSYGVDESRLQTVNHDFTRNQKDFVVRVIQSRHGWRRRKPPRPNRTIEQPIPQPILGKYFVEGGSYLYYFDYGKYRVLHQSTANFDEQKLGGVHPDIVLMAVGDAGYNLEQVLARLKPKVIILHHYDQWRIPFREGIPANRLNRAQDFARAIRAADPTIKVIIPETFFSTYSF